MKNKVIRLIVECNIDDKSEEKISEMCTVKYSLPDLGCYVVEIKEDDYNKIAGLQGVKAVYKSAHITAQMDSVRPSININTQNLETKSLKGKNIGIAILDTGVAPVKDLCLPNNRIVAFRDFIGGESVPYDDNAHGTHVA